MNRPLFSSSAHAASRAASNEFCESPSRRVEFLVLACLFLIVLCMTNPTDRCLGAGAERHGPRALKDFWRGPTSGGGTFFVMPEMSLLVDARPAFLVEKRGSPDNHRNAAQENPKQP